MSLRSLNTERCTGEPRHHEVGGPRHLALATMHAAWNLRVILQPIHNCIDLVEDVGVGVAHRLAVAHCSRLMVARQLHFEVEEVQGLLGSTRSGVLGPQNNLLCSCF